jgi:6-pyruvoyltetrahydropterin/6-carboxytetrahydropterin synthase
VHETDTGYAQGFKEDAHSEIMGTIKLEDIVFSAQVQSEWSDSTLWDKLLNHIHIKNPKKV